MRVVGRSGIVMDLSPSLARGLIRSGAVELVDAPAPAAESEGQAAPGAVQVPGGPQRPPTSGPGSGVQAWRAYYEAVTDESADGMSREQIIEAVGQPE